jgi:cell division protein FtsB
MARRDRAQPRGQRRAVARAAAERRPRRLGLAALHVSRATLHVAQRALVIGLALAVLALFVAGIAEQRWKEAGLRREVAAQTAQLDASRQRNDALRGKLAAASPAAYRAYVEDTARRQLNLGYPDETTVLVQWHDPPGAATPTAAPPSPAPAASAPRTATNWRAWLDFLLGR